MTDPQKLQLERVKIASFNEMDGELVAKDLEENQNLYKAFTFGRFKYGELIELRDLADGHLNADTLMVLTKKEHVEAIKKLSEKWAADEFGYCVVEGRYVKSYETAPFHDEKDLFAAVGGGLYESETIIRIWWD